MVGVQDVPGRLQVGGVVGAHVPRQLQHGVQPGADPAGFRALVAGAFQLADLAQRGLADLLGQVGGLDAGPVLIGPVRFALAQLLADRGQLLAQQEFLLRLLHALAHVLGDLVADLDLGQMRAGPVDQHPQPLGHIDRFQQLALLRAGQVGRVAGGVGQRRRVGQPVDVVDDLPGLAALQHGQQQLLVLRGQRLDLVGDRGVGHRGRLHPQRRAGPGRAGPDLGPALAAHHRGGAAPGDAPDLHDLGDHTVRRVAVLEPGGDQQLTGFARLSGVDRRAGRVVQRDRHHHPGQHDGVGDEQHRHRVGLSHQILQKLSLMRLTQPGAGLFPDGFATSVTPAHRRPASVTPASLAARRAAADQAAATASHAAATAPRDR